MTRLQQPPRIQSSMRGMTLIELVVAIVVIGIAVSTVLSVIFTQATRSAEAMIREQASGIASAYVAEIQQRSGASLPATGNRAAFDDVADYNTIVSAAVSDQWGTVIPGLSQFQVTVKVIDSALNGTPAMLINVIVTHSSGVTVLATGYVV
jgi:MSHA pilin protein MshD